MGVGRDVGPVLGRLLHRRADLGLGVLGDARLGAERQHGAGGDDLDEVRPAVEQRAGAGPHLVGRVGDAEAELGGDGHVARGADHLAAAAGDRDVGAGHRHPGAGDGRLVDGVAERGVHEGAIGADVAHRGEAGEEGGARVPGAGQRLLGAGALQREQHVGQAHLADQVGVAVDEAGQHGEPGGVDDVA